MGSVAAALLCLGGFGAVVYGAGPGDALYGLRVALFGEQQVTRDDRVALAAQTEMQEVQQLIEQGNWDAAQDKLQTVTSTVQTVEDPQRQQELRQQLNDLTVKVETRDPNATAPPLPTPSIVPNASVPSAARTHSIAAAATAAAVRYLVSRCRTSRCRRYRRCRSCRCPDPVCRRTFRCRDCRRCRCRSRRSTCRSRFR